jgi:outer membrane receptor protein involved in Fe transport
VLELFAPVNVVLFAGQDPCASVTTGQCANVPNAGGAILSCPAAQCNQQLSGTLSLRPETGDTKSIGVVVTPTFIDGFTATIDYFDIRVSKFINTVNPNITLSECYGSSATATSEAFFCPLVHRNSLGQIYGGGFVAAPTANTGYLLTRGVDFEANTP